MIRKQAKSIFDGIFGKRAAVAETPPTGIALFETLPPKTPSQITVVRAVARRWKQYSAATVDWTISPHDDMFAGENAMDHYRRVGISALEVITEAMLLARRAKFKRILDLPCGGGRVTRHLVRFFPEAKLFVSDIEKPKQAFVVSQFGVNVADVSSDFSIPSQQQYDLIFVGSLVTHFDDEMFVRLIDYTVAALAPDGILIISTHGRYSAARIRIESKWNWAVRKMIDRQFIRSGFGYVEFGRDRRRYGMSYGVSVSGPAWIMSLLERRADVAVLGFRERGWVDYQDVVVLQKLRGR